MSIEQRITQAEKMVNLIKNPDIEIEIAGHRVTRRQLSDCIQRVRAKRDTLPRYEDNGFPKPPAA